MRSGRQVRVAAGATDQVISAATNFLVLVVAARILDATASGSVVLAMSVALAAVTVQRAIVGDSLLAHGSVVAPERQRKLERDALAAAALIGLGSAVIAVAVGQLPFTVTADIGWVGIWTPFVLVQDAFRYIYYGRRRPELSCVVDATWMLGQLAALALIVALDLRTAPWVLASWGFGGAAGAAVGIAMSRLNPIGGKPRRWIAETKHLSGWFAGQTAMSQTQAQVILFFLGGFISPGAVAGLRFMQNVLVMPAQTLLLAVQSMLVPSYGRLLAAGRLPEVRTLNRKLVVVFSAASVLVGAAVYLVRRPLIGLLFPDYLAYDNLLLPIALATVCYAARTPFTSACRGLQNARGTFIVQCCYTAVTVPACLLGAVWGGALGVAWGFTIGSLALVVSSVVIYVRTINRLAAADTPWEFGNAGPNTASAAESVPGGRD